MKAFLSIKYNGDRRRDLVEALTRVFSEMGINLYCFVRDDEEWGTMFYSSKEMMKLAFKRIKESNLMVVELSEKGVGIGIEAGYAAAYGIPIVIIAPPEADISSTLSGIAQGVFRYEFPEDLLRYTEAICSMLIMFPKIEGRN